MYIAMVLLDYSLGLDFADMWTAALAFLGGPMMKPLILTMGGLLIASIAAKILIGLVWGNM